MRIREYLFMAGVCSVTAAACGGGGGGSTGPTPLLTSLRITPTNPDIDIGGTVTLAATPLDQNGTAMAGLAGATFTSSDPAKATVGASSGVVTGVSAGTPTITASLTAGSITKTATQIVTVDPAVTATITGTGANVWNPHDTDVSPVPPGAVIAWVLSGVHSVVFDTGPAGAVPSNIPLGSTGTSARRTLPAGAYTFHCGVHGFPMSGTITVH